MNGAVILDKTFKETLSHNFEDYPNGIIIPINKPYGWTSADAVRKIKFSLQKHFKLKNIKVGHAGTLDPLATGILIICVGKATKLADTLQSHEKEYIASIEFGATTPSFDLEKEKDRFYPHEHITENNIKNILQSFIGEQEQVPPIFSAKMVNGIRAYELARSGEDVPLRSATVNISDIEMIEFIRKDSDRPSALIRLRCSKGTYIRSFARDIGIALDSGAHLTGLVRTVSGDFLIKNAISLEELKLFFNYYV